MKSRTMRLLLTVATLLASGVSACAPAPISPTYGSTAVSTAVPSPIPSGTPQSYLPETGQATPQSIDALDPQGCEVHLWHSLTGPKEAALRTLAARFEAENPYHIRLRIEFHSPLHKEVLVSIAAGTPPDIVLAHCEQVAEYAQAGVVLPLNEYIHSARYGLSKDEQADLWPVALQAACLPPEGTRQAWGLLFDSQAAVMFYNVGWLKKIKLDAPPQTWDEFGQICSKVRDRKAGAWGFALAPDRLTLLNWIASLGGALINPDTQELTLDSPEAIAALSWLQDYRQKGYVYCASEAGIDRTDFAAEKVLFTFGTTSELLAYAEAIVSSKTKKPRFEWAIAPLPHATLQPIVNVQGLIMSVLRTTPRQQLAAWMFLRWLLRPENDAQWALATGALPLRKSSLDLPDMQAYLQKNPQYEAACQLLAYAQTEPAVSRWQDICTLLVNAATAVCQGRAEPADALAAADVAADSLLTQ